MIVLFSLATFAQQLDADPFRPVVEAGRFVQIEGTDAGDPFSARIDAWYARDALVFYQGDAANHVLADAVGVQLGAAVGTDRVRATVQMPMYAFAAGTGVSAPGGPRLADPRLGLKLIAVPADDPGPVGLAVAGHVDLPSGAATSNLGRVGLSGDVVVALDVDAGGAGFGATGGYRFVEAGRRGGVSIDDAVLFGLGLGADVGPLALAVEASGSWIPSHPAVESTPVELDLSAARTFADGGSVRALVGTAVTPGIGAPLLRIGVGGAFAAP